jgi:aryl-alcohol dehydrogenase-like predicted oxidoreductase/predicted kinase
MRLSDESDDAQAIETIRVALEGGIRILDTAQAYGRDAQAGQNERLVAQAIRASGIEGTEVRIVTKVGMRRPEGRWVPDGRATAIEHDARASLEALDGLPIDLLLLHAIDPRTPIATSMRALHRELERGTARSIGICNVTRTQLEEALRIGPIAAVQVALGAFDDASARGGVVTFCAERGIEVLAHSPLGGPKRVGRLTRDRALVAIARTLGVPVVELVIAWLSRVHPTVVPLFGARRPATVHGLLSALRLDLAEGTLQRLDERFPTLGALRRPSSTSMPTAASDRKIVLLMGIPGAGKSRASIALEAEGYERLNRDERGGTLKDLARALDQRMKAGARAIVLDGTYVTRAARNDVVTVARRHGATVRCVMIDAPLHEAQVNVVHRMLERYGRPLHPDELVAAQTQGRDANVVRPNVLFRMTRELEPPAEDEGFDSIERVSFVRAHDVGATRAGAAIALEAMLLDRAGTPALHENAATILARTPHGAPCVVLGWDAQATLEWEERARTLVMQLGREMDRVVELALCRHPAGPPVCWCRPPLPALWIDFARRHAIDARTSILIGDSPTMRTMARTVGVTHLVVDEAAR